LVAEADHEHDVAHSKKAGYDVDNTVDAGNRGRPSGTVHLV